MTIKIKIYFNEQIINSFSGNNYLIFKNKINTDLVIRNIEAWIRGMNKKNLTTNNNQIIKQLLTIIENFSTNIFDKDIAGN